MDASTHNADPRSEGAADFSPRGPEHGSPPTISGVLSWFSRIARGPAAGTETDGFRLRRWFACFLAWLGLLTVVALVSFARHERGEVGAQNVWLVSIALFFLSICCVFFPAPTAWIVMLLASDEVALLESVSLRVVVVSCACSVATAMANLNEYHLLTFLLRYGRVARVRQTRAYRIAARWFSTAPFVVIAVVGFLPIPVDVVRWLAIAHRYSRWRFFVAYFVGRSLRYGLLAVSTVWFVLGWSEIAIIQVALVLLAGAKMLHGFLRNRRRDGGSMGDGCVQHDRCERHRH